MASNPRPDSPADDFDLDRIMVEDAKRRENVLRGRKWSVRGEDAKFRKAHEVANAGSAGYSAYAARASKTPTMQNDSVKKEVKTNDGAFKKDRRASLAKKVERDAANAAIKEATSFDKSSRKETPTSIPAMPEADLLRPSLDHGKRSGNPSEIVEQAMKKRKWSIYIAPDLPPESMQSGNEILHPTNKRSMPVVVEILSSSDDELAKPTISQYNPHAVLPPSKTPSELAKPIIPQQHPHTIIPPLRTAVKLDSNDEAEMRAAYGAPLKQPPNGDPPTVSTEPQLCAEQAALVKLILSGRNVFYTGSAGCGKSTVLKAFVKRLREHPIFPKQVDIIAPTGRAALDINGSTFWTYAGWTPDHMKRSLIELKKAAHGKWVSKRLRETDVLVIDEISMVENHHFERLNQVMKEARGSKEAFGGVQLVVTGDFCQLPPVKPFQYCIDCGFELKQDQNNQTYTCPQHKSYNDSDKWAFCSSAWEECKFEHVNLTNIHRQNDEVFISMLQKCRLGIPFNPKEEDVLLNHHSQVGNAVKLFPTREEVRVVNQTAFNKLPTQKKLFKCYDDFRCHSQFLESKSRRSEYDNTLLALRDHRFEACIELKQGMHVVLLVNLDIKSGLVNGSQGVITGFEKADPAKLPQAVKPSKQGQSQTPTNGAPALNGDYAEVRAENIRTFVREAATQEWPVVLFQNRVTQTIMADCRVNELGDEKPYSLLSRTQIPLVAGWAMTVHKSQGMTLNRVLVNLAKSFEEGQMYVALSRARSLEGLKVEGLGRPHGGNEQVKQFLWEKFGIQECAPAGLPPLFLDKRKELDTV